MDLCMQLSVNKNFARVEPKRKTFAASDIPGRKKNRQRKCAGGLRNREKR